MTLAALLSQGSLCLPHLLQSSSRYCSCLYITIATEHSLVEEGSSSGTAKKKKASAVCIPDVNYMSSWLVHECKLDILDDD